MLAEALSPVENQISLAFVFGSLARGEQQLSSDVDVMLVGSMGFADAVRMLHQVQDILRREFNPVVYSPDEFQRRSTSGDSFIREVLSKPKLFIVGNEDELRKLTQNQTAFQALPKTIGLEQSTVIVLDALRKQRNVSDYEGESMTLPYLWFVTL